MSTAYANLLDAMVGHIRGTPNLVAAFGDEGPSIPAKDKFWPSPVRDGVELPWAVYEDVAGNTQYMTAGSDGFCPSIQTGAIRFVVVAAGKDLALSLARMLLKTLNDAPLEFMDGLLMYFRASGAPTTVPITSILPNCPNGYAYGFTIDTMVQTTA